MSRPKVTFFCESDIESLPGILSESTLSDLIEMEASVSLGTLDFSEARAKLVQSLNKIGIPTYAWLLLPEAQGYWLNANNCNHALERYERFMKWTSKYDLKWVGVGLDIEPEINDLRALSSRKWSLLLDAVKRVFRRGDYKRAVSTYRRLVERIHSDGYLVDSYQLPFIVDERKVRSTLLQRFTSLVDIQVDREILMLYSSLLRPNGPSLITSYGPDADAIGLGSTSGTANVGFGVTTPLEWEELSRDMRLAWFWSDDVFIFSLEGCVQQGYLTRLKSFEWDYPLILPEKSTEIVNNWRFILRTGLWISAHGFFVLLGIMGLVLISVGLRRIWHKL